MALNYVTLTGTLPGGANAQAIFTASNWETDSVDQLLLPPAPVLVTLNGVGKFSVSLVATDNANLPAGWSWTVEFYSLPGVPPYTFSFFLPHSGGATQDISALATTNPTPITTCLPTPSGTALAGYAPIATGTGQASAWGPLFAKVADTGAGFTLQNATPTIWSWVAPNDGNAHTVMLNAMLSVTSNQTGGAVNLLMTLPDGSTYEPNIFSGSQGAGPHGNFNSPSTFIIKAASTISLLQTSAQTVGAATLWATLLAV